jgi:signal transduction histidine kinase
LSKARSLDQIFQKLAVRWSIIGFVLMLTFASIALFYTAKNYSEKHIDTLARSAALAFRPAILSGHIRETQLQLSEALSLKSGESVVVLGPDLKAIHPIADFGQETNCLPAQKYCWPANFTHIETLYPIYFDAENKELFGYIDLKVRPELDLKVVGAILLMLLITFLVQALGLVSALGTAARNIAVQLKDWTALLRDKNALKLPNSNSNNLTSLKEEAENLNQEIERIKKSAADEAKAAAQLSILKEIGHDLKTPLGQLAKHFALHIHSIRSGSKADDEQTSRIERIIARMQNLVRQTRALHLDLKAQDASCLLVKESKMLIEDVAHDPELAQKRIQLAFDHETPEAEAKIPPIAYQRILDNLLRNSIHAVPEGGVIEVALFEERGRPVLLVRDNGHGIPKDVQSRIFDFDYSTKPSRGTGMGLGIVKKLCNDFEAEISLASRIGHGTDFKVSFQPTATEAREHEISHTGSR